MGPKTPLPWKDIVQVKIKIKIKIRGSQVRKDANNFLRGSLGFILNP